MEHCGVTGRACVRLFGSFICFRSSVTAYGETMDSSGASWEFCNCFSVPEAALPALNQKRQSLSVMAQLIIKHETYLRRAPSIYFHLSDRDGCTNSIRSINKREYQSLSPKTNLPAPNVGPCLWTVITQRLIKKQVIIWGSLCLSCCDNVSLPIWLLYPAKSLYLLNI